MFTLDTSGTRVPRTDFEIENEGDKILISPDTNGYINDTLQTHLELAHKNTVVINAPVGQGKSYAIIQTVKRYFDSNERYLVFVVSPFVSLVKQYCVILRNQEFLLIRFIVMITWEEALARLY
jgi:hypothetical protein